MLTKAFIPYRGYYSTPFAQWQGTLANENAIALGAATSKRFFESKGWDPKAIEYVLVGSTVYQQHWFYTGPWAAAMMGAENSPGVLITQACSTSAFSLYQAGHGGRDRHVREELVPAGRPLLQRPARRLAEPERPRRQAAGRRLVHGQRQPGPVGRSGDDPDRREREQGSSASPAKSATPLTLRRYEQYQDALANDREFQKRYMFADRGAALQEENHHPRRPTKGSSPPRRKGWPASARSSPDGVHTFGAQTFPADGNCGVCVTTRDKARELSADPNIEVQLVSFGYARTKKALHGSGRRPVGPDGARQGRHQGERPDGGQDPQPVRRQRHRHGEGPGARLNTMNNYGSSLIYGHPAGADRGPADDRRDRGTRHERGRVPPLLRLRRRRHRRLDRHQGRE